jgi:hypothetical protein
MSALLKTWASTILVWGAMATLAHANPTPVLWDWTAWVAGTGVREGAAGSAGSSGGGTPALLNPLSTLRAETVAAPSPTPPPPSSPPDAFLNFGSSPYPEQSLLTIGTAQPWYTSGTVAKVFGHTPTAQEQQAFISGVSADVQQTFDASGLTGSHAVSLTTDPAAGARHTLSVVSGLSYGSNPNAIGITDVGANGFSFLDKLSYANTPQELEWALAHNIAHELMHSFGVGTHHDLTGKYLDAATADWSMLVNPQATLSQAAVDDIVAHNIGRNGNTSMGVGGQLIDGDMEILAPVPEPATIAFWGLAVTALVLQQRRRAERRRAA